MVVDHIFQHVLIGKHAVILSSGSDVTSELGLKLAMHGCEVLAVGADETGLQRLQHEIQDVGGVCSYRVINTGTESAYRDIADVLFEIPGGVQYLVDDTGNEKATLSQAVRAEYARQVSAGLHPGSLEHVIIVNHQNAAGEARVSKIPMNNVHDDRVSVVFTDILDPMRAGSLMPAVESYSAIVATEVLHLLAHDDYGDVDQVSIHNHGDDIVARLHSDWQPGKPLQQVRRGRVLDVYISSTANGRAVFAGRDFKRGELIFETSGTFLTHQTEHTLQIGWDLHLEPDSPIRLMNHSCEPAAGVKTNARNLPDFYAFRDIKKGEEITFDYAMTEYAHYPREDPSLEFSLECRCGTPSCRGKLGYYSELPDEIKKKYEGYVSAYLLRPQKG